MSARRIFNISKFKAAFQSDKVRFVAVGILSTLVNFFLYYAIVELFNSVITASILGYIAGLSVSFYFGRTWVFGRRFNKSVLLTIKFICVYLLGMLMMTMTISFTGIHFSVDYRFIWLLGVIVSTTNNYLGTKYFVFIKDKT